MTGGFFEHTVTLKTPSNHAAVCGRLAGLSEPHIRSQLPNQLLSSGTTTHLHNVGQRGRQVSLAERHALQLLEQLRHEW